MSAAGTREFDFTRVVGLIGALAPVVLVAGTGYTVWISTEQPRWFVLAGAVAIAIGTAVWGRIAWSELVRRATVDDRRLRVVTANGQEHVVERTDITVDGIPSTVNGRDTIARLLHPGGVLYVLRFRPAGAELVDLLNGSRARE